MAPDPRRADPLALVDAVHRSLAAAAPGVDAVADAALYDAKALGRDRFAFFDDARRVSLHRRLEIETELRSGLNRGEFIPWFQPEYDLVDGSITGVEALARWVHPSRGVVEARSFIDVAEEIGLAPRIGQSMLDQGLGVLRGWMDDGFETRMRVNIAAAQLQSHLLVAEIGAGLESHDIPARLLCVEITERSLLLDPETAVDTLRAVRSLGVEVAVDDFGTGFSSLARLKDFPVNALKIDRSFVNGIVDSATDREIVRTVVGLARGLGLDVVAEGVEHSAQVGILVELGCRRAQGWLWSRAVPAEVVPALARVAAPGSVASGG